MVVMSSCMPLLLVIAYCLPVMSCVILFACITLYVVLAGWLHMLTLVYGVLVARCCCVGIVVCLC